MSVSKPQKKLAQDILARGWGYEEDDAQLARAYLGLVEQFDALLRAALALDDQFVAGESVDPDSPEALAFHRAVSFPAKERP